MSLFIVTSERSPTNDTDSTVIVDAPSGDREQAKREARKTLGGNVDRYIVTPIGLPGMRHSDPSRTLWRNRLRGVQS